MKKRIVCVSEKLKKVDQGVYCKQKENVIHLLFECDHVETYGM